jgi:hypothetical protein
MMNPTTVITCPHCKKESNPSPVTAVAMKLSRTIFTGHMRCPHCGTEMTISNTMKVSAEEGFQSLGLKMVGPEGDFKNLPDWRYQQLNAARKLLGRLLHDDKLPIEYIVDNYLSELLAAGMTAFYEGEPY